MRLALLLVIAAGAALFAAPQQEFVQAVEFQYNEYPRHLWERELVWLKKIGVRTIEFSVPAGSDLTGAANPRNDLIGFVRILRRLQMRAWVRLPRTSSRMWLSSFDAAFATQVEKHGGPIAFVEGGTLDAPQPPGPVVTIAANDPAALAKSRDAMTAAHGSLVWTGVEDSLPEVGPLVRHGVVSLSGDETPGSAVLRRDAALLRGWASLMPGLKIVRHKASQAQKLPEGVTMTELIPQSGEGASAASVVNQSSQAFKGDIRVYHPGLGRTMLIPGVQVPAGGALWLPVDVPLQGTLCTQCTNFAKGENIAYATAELLSIEYENGVLAMEFAAHVDGEVVLQLSRKPSGPYVAAGRPRDIEFDEKSMRARLPIPAGKGAADRVRVGLAIEPPESSSFFVNATRLVIGQTNTISTSYSSEALAQRSRLLLPEGYTAKAVVKSPMEIDYEVAVPADALHGSWANLVIEADGVPMGRARLQLFRPASVRIPDAVKLHLGSTELAVDPPVVVFDPKAGRNLSITIRNNTPQIQTYTVEATGEGLQFFPPKTEISIGAVMERNVELRIFGADGATAVMRPIGLKVSGGASISMPVRMVAVPRGATVTWSADLDGDGSPEWVIENQRVRAVFSAKDGGRWIEFVWKDAGVNVLPDMGALGRGGPAKVKEIASGLEFTGNGWTRTVKLDGTTVTVEQSTTLPAETLKSGEVSGVSLTVSRTGDRRAEYRVERK